MEACPGDIHKSVPGGGGGGGGGDIISLSRGAFIYCPGGTFAIIVICGGVWLNNGIAQYDVSVQMCTKLNNCALLVEHWYCAIH